LLACVRGLHTSLSDPRVSLMGVPVVSMVSMVSSRTER
jgi:hypothetical protein